MSAARGCEGHIAGFYGAGLAVIVIFALAGKNIVGLALAVMLVISKRGAGVDGHLRVQPALAVQFLFTENMLNDDLACASSHLRNDRLFHKMHLLE